MKIVITIEEEKYEYSTPIDFPDAEQFMHAIEQIINKVGYPEKDIEDYKQIIKELKSITFKIPDDEEGEASIYYDSD